MKLTLNAIVLRDYKIEDDRVLTLLTQEHGVLTAYAGGANRMRSSLSASTELLCYSQLVLFHNRGRYSVNNADTIRTFFGLRSQVESLALASYFAELSAQLAARDDGEACLRLLLNTLHFLEKNLRPAALLKPLFELRLLALLGYMPDLVACRVCGGFESPVMHFYPAHGDLLCAACAAGQEHDSTGDAFALSPTVLAAMRHIVFCDLEKLFSFSLPAADLDRLGFVVESFLTFQLEKSFPTLEFYHRLLRPLAPV